MIEAASDRLSHGDERTQRSKLMEDNNRTTQDLIAELEHTAEGWGFAMLGVAFTNTTVFIQHTDPKRQKLLDEAVMNGGEPFGWFRIRQADGHTSMECGLLREHKDEPPFQELLETLKDNVLAIVKSQRCGAN
jgi:hypothetical protein